MIRDRFHELRDRLLVANSDFSVFQDGGAGQAKLGVYNLATGERLAMVDLAAVIADPPDGAVYFGDGIWDARASRRLGIGFVGIAAEPGKRERLEAEGVTVILDGFGDIGEVVDAAERALSIASA